MRMTGVENNVQWYIIIKTILWRVTKVKKGEKYWINKYQIEKEISSIIKYHFNLQTWRRFNNFLMLVCLNSIWYNNIARFDEIDVLKELLSTGLDINSQDSFGTTALHNASTNGNLFDFFCLISFRVCVKFLIENGCKFLKNDSGNTPLRSNFFELLLTRSSCSSRTFWYCKRIIKQIRWYWCIRCIIWFLFESFRRMSLVKVLLILHLNEEMKI